MLTGILSIGQIFSVDGGGAHDTLLLAELSAVHSFWGAEKESITQSCGPCYIVHAPVDGPTAMGV